MLLTTNRTRYRYVTRKPYHTAHASNLGGEFVIDHYTENGGVIGSLTNHLEWEFPSFLRYEEIHDVVGKKRYPDGSFDPSPVHRFEARVQTKDVPDWTQYSGTAGVYVKRFDCYVTPTLLSNAVPLCPDGLWINLASEAFNDFATQIPDDISIANFTWELREIGQLLPKLSNTLSKTVAGGYLNFEFGWKPFLSDLSTLTNVLSSLNSKIQHLRDTYGKKTRLGSYRADIYQPVFADFVTIVDEGPVEAVRFLWELDGYRADFRAGGYLFHTLEELDSLYGYIRALTVSLGLSNPLKVVWNALPYSFVVDWFAGLSGRLDSLSVNPFKGRWDVSRLSSSIKETATLNVSVMYGSPAAVSQQRLGTITVSRYRRISSLPVEQGFLSSLLSTPTSKQQSLLLALFV